MLSQDLTITNDEMLPFGYTCPNNKSCGFKAQSIPWDNINSEDACIPNTPVYEKWSKPNEFCNEYGEFVLPINIVSVRAFMCLSLIFALLSSILGCHSINGDTFSAYMAGICSLLTLTFVVCGLADYALWDYTINILNDKAYIVLYDETGTLVPIKADLFVYGNII